MQSKATTPAEYLETLPDGRKEVITRLRETILKNLPEGFTENMNYGMLGYSVPHTIYPAGYHCDPKLPLPFISLASQKNHISLHHMGFYEGDLLNWFREEWPKHSAKKLDLGRCCMRFKKPEDIPFELLASLFAKLTPQDWVFQYETQHCNFVFSNNMHLFGLQI